MGGRYFCGFWRGCFEKAQSAGRRGHDRRHILAAVVAILAFLAPAPAVAEACGMPLEARIPSEQALVTFANGREEIITSVQLQSDAPGAAVVFPVPGEPEVSALPSNTLFDYLAEVTRPEVITREVVIDERGPAVGGAAPGGVSVLGREVIGGYDVARLAADDPNALQAWLAQNGYSIPPGAAPILKAYVDEGWKFVAVKLAGAEGANGALTPLRMAFDAREIVYPMRLGSLSDRPVDVLLYVLAEHRVEIPQMTAEYAGPVDRLSQPPPADLRPLFRAPYLTKLRNSNLAPESLTSDFVARPAPTDEAYRMTETRTIYIEAPRARFSAGMILGLACAFTASMMALGIAFGLRRRMDRIAGTPDEDE